MMKFIRETHSAQENAGDISLSIFYCQAFIDNGSDTSNKLTRSSPLHINH
jgi:hypothetical protein